jgi:hypothetical protein
MAKSAKPAAKSVTFKYTSEVKVTVPEFRIAASVAFLDTEALARVAKATIDVGSYKTACCERHVRAVVNRGMVVGIETDPCSDAKSAGPAIADVAKTAFKRIGGNPGKWKPVRVGEFLAKLLQEEEPITNCIEFTIFGHTFFCCRTGNGPVSCVDIEPITVNR